METNDSGAKDTAVRDSAPPAEGASHAAPNTDTGTDSLIMGKYKDQDALISAYKENQARATKAEQQAAELEAKLAEQNTLGKLGEAVERLNTPQGPSESDMRAQLEERAEKYGVPVELLEDLGMSRVQMQDALKGEFEGKFADMKKALDDERAERAAMAIKQAPYYSQFSGEIEQLRETLGLSHAKAIEAHRIANAGRQPEIEDGMRAPAGTAANRVSAHSAEPKTRWMTDQEKASWSVKHPVLAEMIQNDPKMQEIHWKVRA